MSPGWASLAPPVWPRGIHRARTVCQPAGRFAGASTGQSTLLRACATTGAASTSMTGGSAGVRVKNQLISPIGTSNTSIATTIWIDVGLGLRLAMGAIMAGASKVPRTGPSVP